MLICNFELHLNNLQHEQYITELFSPLIPFLLYLAFYCLITVCMQQ